MDLDRFRDVRWVQGGRQWPELDCYGVVNEVRRALGLAEWPEYSGVTREDDGLARAAGAIAARQAPCSADAGAVAFCYEGSAVAHVAVLVMQDGRLHALECNPGRNVTILPLARLLRRFVRVEFYT